MGKRKFYRYLSIIDDDQIIASVYSLRVISQAYNKYFGEGNFVGRTYIKDEIDLKELDEFENEAKQLLNNLEQANNNKQKNMIIKQLANFTVDKFADLYGKFMYLVSSHSDIFELRTNLGITKLDAALDIGLNFNKEKANAVIESEKFLIPFFKDYKIYKEHPKMKFAYYHFTYDVLKIYTKKTFDNVEKAKLAIEEDKQKYKSLSKRIRGKTVDNQTKSKLEEFEPPII